MSVVTTSESQTKPEQTGIRPRRWNRAEYYRAAELGLFGPDEHLELIDGEIIETVSPHRTPHATAILRTQRLLFEHFGSGGTHIRAQLPIVINDRSEPGPDFVVVSGNELDYSDRHPNSSDIQLLIEVSDTTLPQDRTRKSSLYAAAGIAEYWILNLVDHRLEVYRDADAMADAPFGANYQSRTLYSAADQVNTLFAPGQLLLVADLLPPRTDTGTF